MRGCAFRAGPAEAPRDKPPAASPTADASAEKEKDKPKWDVSKPGYAYDVAVNLDVDTGTWMSVDVSPDGKEIVFDLLGDLYTMPISGGDARALTSGIPWDMQPRYSPDGKWIAFTSDRSGGDNIWIVDREGKNPQQVTKETFRLPNSPAWTPDSQFIAARKHFTGTRSAGAGEIWLYHRSGGEGLQMTKRATEQKDEGEPAFSPDGRYLYWSADTTPGKLFEYNKDPNQQIYVIKRLDRETGKILNYVTGAGRVDPSDALARRQVPGLPPAREVQVDALRAGPRVGRRAARSGTASSATCRRPGRFTASTRAWRGRRIRNRWCSGRAGRSERVGRLRATQAAVIPFRVKDTRQTATAVRFGVDVLTGLMQASASPAVKGTFPVRMLRTVAVSPDGKRVAYQALGYIYLRDLPNGTPKRLTTQTDHFEFYPVLVARLEVARLRDVERRDARVRSASPPFPGGASRIVSDKPGHYLDPVFSPDGARIVYTKATGGFLRPTNWSAEPGHLRRPRRGRKALARRRGRLRAALRQGLRPRLLRQDRGRRRPDRSREAGLRLDRARRLGRPRVLPLRAGAGVRDLAGRQVARVPRGLPGLRHARSSRPAAASTSGPRARPCPVTRVSKDAGENLALLRRLDAALLVVRAAALRAQPQGRLRVPAGRAREIARARRRRA